MSGAILYGSCVECGARYGHPRRTPVCSICEVKTVTLEPKHPQAPRWAVGLPVARKPAPEGDA